MKRIINLSAILVLMSIFTTTAFAQQQNNQSRKMVKAQSSQGASLQGENWVDANGDGICDNFGTDLQGQGNGKGYGLKDGTRGGVKPQDGTGFGKGNGNGLGIGSGSGTGECDGTGSKGSNKRLGKK